MKNNNLDFSRRLKTAMLNRGHIALRGNKSGIDLKLLAEIAGTTYEMARRYATAQNIPSYEVVLKIARFLETDPSWLMFGEPAKNNKPVLDEIIEFCKPIALTIKINESTLNFFNERAKKINMSSADLMAALLNNAAHKEDY